MPAPDGFVTFTNFPCTFSKSSLRGRPPCVLPIRGVGVRVRVDGEQIHPAVVVVVEPADAAAHHRGARPDIAKRNASCRKFRPSCGATFRSCAFGRTRTCPWGPRRAPARTARRWPRASRCGRALVPLSWTTLKVVPSDTRLEASAIRAGGVGQRRDDRRWFLALGRRNAEVDPLDPVCRCHAANMGDHEARRSASPWVD